MKHLPLKYERTGLPTANKRNTVNRNAGILNPAQVPMTADRGDVLACKWRELFSGGSKTRSRDCIVIDQWFEPV